MRIVILNPPHPTAIIREGRCQSPQNMRKTSVPQMTLAYLAGVLQREDHELKVYDCIAAEMSSHQLFESLEMFHPELALINTTTPSINADMEFVVGFKACFPTCHTALFGTHVTALHEEVLRQNPDVDSIIRHEPEWTALELVEVLQRKTVPETGISGCTMRIGESIVAAPDRPYPPDLDNLGYPAWEHFDRSCYIHPVFNKPYVMVNTSRGCVHNCIFCVASLFYGKKVRYRSVPSIVDEIEHHVIGRFGIRHVWMYADDFTCSPHFVKELCRAIIDRNLKITWWTNTRVDNHDEEMFRLMKEAGCFMLSIGGESGNAEILQRIRKGTRPDNIRKTITLLRDVGINSLVYFLIGLPGETRETIAETIMFAKTINPDYVEFYPATPYPGTRFYDICREENRIVNTNWDDFMCGGNEFVVDIPGVSKGELDDILRRAYREFYFRPGYGAVLLRRALRPAEFLRLVSFGLGYLSRFFAPTARPADRNGSAR